jgi:hypothetical protein
MEKLFADKFVTERGFASTEEYISYHIKGNTSWIEFPNLHYYLSLIKNNLLVTNNVVRTSDRGVVDECYLIIDRKGTLRGITEIAEHQGMKGIFKPEEILKGQRISDGWMIYGRTLEKNIELQHRNV